MGSSKGCRPFRDTIALAWTYPHAAVPSGVHEGVHLL